MRTAHFAHFFAKKPFKSITYKRCAKKHCTPRFQKTFLNQQRRVGAQCFLQFRLHPVTVCAAPPAPQPAYNPHHEHDTHPKDRPDLAPARKRQHRDDHQQGPRWRNALHVRGNGRPARAGGRCGVWQHLPTLGRVFATVRGAARWRLRLVSSTTTASPV